jgi:NMD protein affecting ribosome stability and mRNA decay
MKMEKLCVTCNGYEKEGYINGMCDNCYDMYLDIGKGILESKKKELESRRVVNGYYKPLGVADYGN